MNHIRLVRGFRVPFSILRYRRINIENVVKQDLTYGKVRLLCMHMKDWESIRHS